MNFKKGLILLAVSAVIVAGYFVTAYSQNSGGRYNVVFISLDTTRADYVDTGNGANAKTPSLHAFGQKAVTFEHAFCVIPQTLPSHLALFTGKTPAQCGVYDNSCKYDGKHIMLQQVLKRNNYSTAAVVSLGTLSSDTGIASGFDIYRENLNPPEVFYTDAQRVTREGEQLVTAFAGQKKPFFLFLHYSDPHSPYAPPNADGEMVVEVDGKIEARFNAYRGAILKKQLNLEPGSHKIRFYLDKKNDDFNGFVLRKLVAEPACSMEFENIVYSSTHYKGAHILGSEGGGIRLFCPSKTRFNLFQVIPLLNHEAAVHYYRREVEYMDKWVGRFLDFLENRNLMDKTIVVITADHGEGLGERELYFGHVRYLNRQFIQVPLMIYMPGVAARRIQRPVSHLDVAPTLLDFMGMSPGTLDTRRSLYRIIREHEYPGDPLPVYAFAFSPSSRNNKVAVINWPFQCIFVSENPGEVAREYYNLDKSEAFNSQNQYGESRLQEEFPHRYRFFRHVFSKLIPVLRHRPPAKGKGEGIKLEKLKTLGYVQ